MSSTSAKQFTHVLDACLKWQRDKPLERREATAEAKKVGGENTASSKDVDLGGKRSDAGANKIEIDSEKVQLAAGQLYRIQMQRMVVYDSFQKILAELMKTDDANAYRVACGEITKEFAQLSASVRSLESSLVADGFEGLVAFLRSIQDTEREKLQTVARLHLLQHHEKRGTLKKEDGPVLDILRRTVDSLNARLKNEADELCMISNFLRKERGATS